MNLEKRKQWLKNLEVGEEVAIKYSSGHYLIQTVKRVTPTGIIVLNNGDRFNPDGKERGRDSWNNVQLTPITSEILQCVEYRKYLNKIMDTDLKKLPLHCLKSIYNVLDEFDKNGLQQTEE